MNMKPLEQIMGINMVRANEQPTPNISPGGEGEMIKFLAAITLWSALVIWLVTSTGVV